MQLKHKAMHNVKIVIGNAYCIAHCNIDNLLWLYAFVRQAYDQSEICRVIESVLVVFLSLCHIREN